MSFILSDDMITKIAERAEKCISVVGHRSRSADHLVIENAIRQALIQQAQMLIEVAPTVATANGALNLNK